MTAQPAGRPRIVHVTTSHPADDVRIFERECRSLAATGKYDVYLAAAGSIPSTSGVLLVPLSAVPDSRLRRFVSGPRKALGLGWALTADLWHFHDPELVPVALKLAASGTKVIWDAHEDYAEQLSEDGAKDWVPRTARHIVRCGMEALLGAIDRRAAGVVAATTKIASRYHNACTVVVGNEARLDEFADCRPDFGARQVLFLGPVGSGQLFDAVVEAVANLPGVSMAVGGREPDARLWAAAQSRLGSRLRHLGWLDRAGVADAINSSSLGMVTYADLPTNSENAGNKLFEFCAAGLPVVVTPTPSNIRFIREGGIGFLSRAFSAASLAEAIAIGLSDPLDWDRASRGGRAWVAANGSWVNSEERLLDLYERILGSGAQSPFFDSMRLE